MASTTKLSNILDFASIVPQPDAPILQMPNEMTALILSHLPSQQVGLVTLVCKKWCHLFECDDAFRSIFHSQFSNFDKNFKEFYHFYSNLIKKVYASHTFVGHEGSVDCLAIAGETIISGSADRTIKAWDIKTGNCLATFEGYDWVRCFIVVGETLFSGSDDPVIRAWDIKTRNCLATFEGHEYSVLCLAVAEEILFSGASDDTIKAWDIKTKNCLATLEGHKGSVNCLAVVGKTLFSGSEDATIKAWNIKTRNCLATFEGHKGNVNCFAVIGEILFSGSDDDTIKAWDIKTGNCLATFEGHEFSAVRCFAVAGKTLFSGSFYQWIKAWDYTADHSEIFKEIAKLLETGTTEATQKAFERFSKMPIRARIAICEILHDILNEAKINKVEICTYGKVATSETDEKRSASPEDIFYDKCNWRKATSAQKNQAIWLYLIELPSLHQAGSSSGTGGFSANGKRSYTTAFENFN